MFCNFLDEYMNKKECNESCRYYDTCTRRGSANWADFLGDIENGRINPKGKIPKSMK